MWQSLAAEIHKAVAKAGRPLTGQSLATEILEAGARPSADGAVTGSQDPQSRIKADELGSDSRDFKAGSAG